MPDPTFLTVEQVKTVHQRMTAEFGGATFLRDPGLLESAVMLPAARFDGNLLHDGIAAMAAAYLFHICRNHPFADGNKRTALASAEIFLLLNGHELDASNDAMEALTWGVAEGSTTKEETVAFFQHHAKSQ